MILSYKNYIYIISLIIFNIIKIQSCIFNNLAGAYVDLSVLSQTPQTSHSNNGEYDARFNVCGNQNYVTSCKTGNLASLDSFACQIDKNNNYYELGSSSQPLVVLTDYGFSVTYSSSSTIGGCTGGRKFNVQTTCDQTVDTFTSDPALNSESPICTYVVYGKSKYACKTCDHLNNCNGHGSCVAASGTCSCNDQFNGTTCSNSRLEIFNVIPATVKGGSIFVNGYFGTTSNNVKITIGDDGDCEITQKNKTTITCTVAPGNGTYDVKVEDNGFDFTLQNAFTYQLLVCNPACNSLHGQCNPYTAECICDDQTNSTTCSNSKLEIHSVTPTSVLGGEVIINGYFGTTHSLEVFIGDEQCDIKENSSTLIKCNIDAGEGTFDVKVQDRDLEVSLEDGFTYQYLVCDPICNPLHGECNKYTGKCICDDQSNSTTCSDSKLEIHSVTPATILGGEVIINGYFGTTHSLEVFIGDEQCDIKENSSTLIKCDIGAGEGTFDVKVQDRDLEVSLEDGFTYQYLECEPECKTTHSKCNGKTAVCECDSQTKMENGECVSKIYLSSVTSTTTDGGIVYLNGYFGTTTPLLDVKIGKLKCQNAKSLNDSTLSCNIGPGEGWQDVIVTDNDLSTSGKNYFKYYKTNLDCPNNCSNNGDCDSKKGSCNCFENWNGFDCSSKINNNKPSLPKIDLKTGAASILNENFNYQLNILSLVELSINGSVVKEYPLTDLTNLQVNVIREGNGVDVGVVALFSQRIDEVNCRIEYTIEEVIGGKKKEFQFADLTFSVDSGSLKTTINITNYDFSSNLNTLQLRFRTAIEKEKLVNDCNSKEMQINSDQLNLDSNFNYLQVSKDSKIISSRFLSRLISDNRIAPTSTSIVSSNNETLETIIGLNIPHFDQFTTLDPDMGVLVSNDYKDSCGKSNKYKIIAISVVVPCVALIAIFLVGAVLYKKHYLRIKLFKNSITDKPKQRKSLHL